MDEQTKRLHGKLARLESAHDHLSTEMHQINALLKKVGFQDGLDTLKQAVHDLEKLQEGEESKPFDDDS